MNQMVNCKFCSKQLLIQIDDDYAALGDPMKLLPFAACNACSDNREQKRNIESAIKRVCIGLVQLRSKVKPKDRDEARTVLIELTKAYAVLIAKWHEMSGMAWEPEFVEVLLDKPGQWPTVLSGYWKHFREVFKRAHAA